MNTNNKILIENSPEKNLNGEYIKMFRFNDEIYSPKWALVYLPDKSGRVIYSPKVESILIKRGKIIILPYKVTN